jgi:glycosyltransferase involved in cell wall biosynthesis
MKRILIFSVAYYPFVGGAEIAVKEITDRIADYEFDLLTVDLDGKQKAIEKVGNVTIYRIGKGFLGKFIFPIRGFFKALSLHKKNSYSIAWSIMASQASIAASFFKIYRPQVKLVLTVQEGDEETHLQRYVFRIGFLYRLLIRPFHTLVFKKADVITVISTYLSERARAINPHVPIEVVPNGVDLSLFKKQYSESDIKLIRKELGVSTEDKILITTSRLVKKNAVGDIVASLKFLPHDVKFIIIGVGQLEFALKNQTRELGLENRVIFVGLKPHQDIPKYLAASDIFIRPSLSEGMGNSFIEAMAAGIPVIATPVGGIPDFLKDPATNPENPTGLFCEVNNPQSIAKKVHMILDNQEIKNKLATNARAFIEGKYEWDTIAQDMNQKVFSKIS